ncbi:MAG: hypothetical protein WC071_02475 [Victivallaceae bacterium]
MKITRTGILVMLLGFITASLLLSGCSSICIEKCSSEQWQKENTELSFNYDGLSNFSRNILISNYLLDDLSQKPDKVIYLLEQLFKHSGETGYLRVLTEVCFHLGNNESDEEKKVAFHAAACYFSYQYLTIQNAESKTSQYSPDFFIMGRYYNSALNTVFTYLSERKLLLDSGFSLPAIANISLTFEAPLYKLPFPDKKNKDMLLCCNFLVSGMQTYTYSYGLGVPLVVVEQDPAVIKPFKPIHEMVYPSTMFMRLSEKSKKGKVPAKLEFYDTLQQESVKVDGKNIPLELDYSTPIAYLLRKPPLMKGMRYMFIPGEADKLNGLYWLTPLSKNKIPVVLVHGLLSNPRTWAQMINTLLGDPRIRQNYQFWFFSYATGNPVLYSASLLRKSLIEAKTCFKDGGEKSFDRMVIIAHSMGGLLSKTTIQNSGNYLVEKIANKNRSEIDKKLTPEQKQFLNEVLVFEKLPFVQRIIFLAVPHRGSDIAVWTMIRWVSAKIIMPSFLTDKIRQLSNKLLIDTHLKTNNEPVYIATGLDNLAPDNKVLQALSEIKMASDVPYHTICGNQEESGVPGGTDGVVPYSSSHLNDARSETVVKSGHSVQENAMAIEEVRRLLLLHLKENGLLKD